MLLPLAAKTQTNSLAYASAWSESGSNSVIADFNSWAAQFVTSSNAALRAQMLPQGIALAGQRQLAMAELIRNDPQKALATTLPVAIRQQLPAEITNKLETRISGIGDFSVIAAQAVKGGPPIEPIQRFVQLDGHTYQAWVYGRRQGETCKQGIPLHGIVLGDQMAVHAMVLRQLEADEVPAPGKRIMDLRPATQPIASGLPAILGEMGSELYRFTSLEQMLEAEFRLEAAENGIGPQPKAWATNVIATFGATGSVIAPQNALTPWTTGLKKVLIIRVDFSDLPGAPQGYPGGYDPDTDTYTNTIYTSPYIQSVAKNEVEPFYSHSSYGHTSLTNTVTAQVYRMPHTAAYYASTPAPSTGLLIDARTAAAAGYTVTNYDRVIILFSSFANVPGADGSYRSYAGWGDVGGPDIWLNGYYSRTVLHELGHTYGLHHAGLWQVNDGNPISPEGMNIVYGDTFDLMGNAYDTRVDINPYFKNLLGWIPDDQIQAATTNGTYRIFGFDSAATPLPAGRCFGLKIAKDANRAYWIGLRRNFANNPTMEQAAYIIWGYQNGTPYGGNLSDLLDLTTPGTNADDAGLPIGHNFIDADAGISILPLAMGGIPPAEWMDVRIGFITNNNHNPTVTFSPSGTPLQARTNIQFSATGSDPDGDPVFYGWDFGDGQTTPSTAATVQHYWLKGGTYQVTCTAYDGRGGVSVQSNLVSVADPLLTWTPRAEGLTLASIASILYEQGQFVAVTHGASLRSQDGVTWIKDGALGDNMYPYALGFGNGRYVTVGQDYDFSDSTWYGSILTSADGVTWSNVTPAKPASLNSVAYGGGRFVAVGQNGQVWYSSDGQTWLEAASPTANELQAVAFGNGRFIAVGNSGTTLTSTDGVLWTSVVIDSSFEFSGVSFLDGLWLVAGGYKVWVSPDGVNWISHEMDVYGSLGPVSALESSRLFLVSAWDNFGYWSDDGVKWAGLEISSTTNYDSINGFAEGNGTVVAVGTSGQIFQAGIPRARTPAILNGAALSAGIPLGRPTAITTFATGFNRVQLLVNGVVVSEASGDNPVFSWTPPAFGHYEIGLRGIKDTGESYASLTNLTTSAALTDWRWANPSPAGNPLHDVVWAAGKWWAVGDNGMLLTSLDGLAWSATFLPDMVNARAVASDGNRMVVAGDVYDYDAGIYRKGIITSTNGVDWPGVEASKLGYTTIRSVAHDANNLWVAVGDYRIYSSTDGVAWAECTLPVQERFNGVSWGNGRWTAVGNGVILSSVDGSQWEEVTPAGFSTTLNAAVYSGGQWVAVGNGVVLTSGDGVAWNLSASGLEYMYDVTAWQGEFVAAGTSGTLLVSSDGVSWDKVKFAPARAIYGIYQNAGQLVAVGDYGNIFTGNSPETMTRASSGRQNELYAVTGDGNHIVAGGDYFDLNASSVVGPLASFTGDSGWQPWANGTNQYFAIRGLTFARGVFVATGDSGKLLVSTNGTDWTGVTSGTSAVLYGVAAGKSNFVAVGSGGTILNSPDGKTWSQRASSTTTTINAVCFSGSGFAAVGENGTILTSPDGLTWSAQTNHQTIPSLNAICWDAAAGYVAVGASGTIVTSSNGTSWVNHTSDKTDTLVSVCSTPWGLVAFTGLGHSLAHVSGDGGVSWQGMSLPTLSIYTSWNDGNKLWVGGTDGRLLYYPLPDASGSPVLEAARVGQNLILSWPATAAGFILESATNPAAALWNSASDTSVVIEGRNVVTNPISGSVKFYRLRR